MLWAFDLAKRLDAEVVVLHVVNDPFSAPGYYKQGADDLLKPMETVAAKMMRRFIKSCGKEIGAKKEFKEVTCKLVTGLPVTRILEVATKLGASQIVMGSQGRTGLERILIGSKAEQVLRMASIPVTIVKAAKGP